MFAPPFPVLGGGGILNYRKENVSVSIKWSGTKGVCRNERRENFCLIMLKDDCTWIAESYISDVLNESKSFTDLEKAYKWSEEIIKNIDADHALVAK